MIYLLGGPAALAAREQWLPVLQRAVDESDGRWSMNQVLEDINDGRLLVWLVTRDEKVLGCFTTRICESRIRYVSIEDVAGNDLASWIHEGLWAVEQWAREMGAEQIVFSGRRGWEKVLRGYGFETKRIEGVKVLATLN